MVSLPAFCCFCLVPICSQVVKATNWLQESNSIKSCDDEFCSVEPIDQRFPAVLLNTRETAKVFDFDAYSTGLQDFLAKSISAHDDFVKKLQKDSESQLQGCANAFSLVRNQQLNATTFILEAKATYLRNIQGGPQMKGKVAFLENQITASSAAQPALLVARDTLLASLKQDRCEISPPASSNEDKIVITTAAQLRKMIHIHELSSSFARMLHDLALRERSTYAGLSVSMVILECKPADIVNPVSWQNELPSTEHAFTDFKLTESEFALPILDDARRLSQLLTLQIANANLQAEIKTYTAKLNSCRKEPRKPEGGSHATSLQCPDMLRTVLPMTMLLWFIFQF